MPSKSPEGRYIVFPKVIYPLTSYFHHVVYYLIYLVQHLLKFRAQLRNATEMFALHLPLLTPKANPKFRETSKVPVSYCAEAVNPLLHSLVTTVLPGRLGPPRPKSTWEHTDHTGQ